jgi:hypothetical protein
MGAAIHADKTMVNDAEEKFFGGSELTSTRWKEAAQGRKACFCPVS